MTLNELRARILNDSETKDLVISDADLVIVNRYLDIRDTIIDGYQPLLKTDPYIEIIYVPTKEKKEEQQKQKLKGHLQVFDSDIYLQEANLKDFKNMNDSREKVLNYAYEFLLNYSKDNYEKGLYIYGPYSTGKTYLLSAIANELAKREINVLMVFMPDLVRTIKQGISSGDLETKINLLKQADVLMIDDIGGENMTPWFRDEIFLPIIQYRLSAKLPVFFSSNLDMKDLMDALTISKGNELDYVKSVRIIQRIKDLTTYINIGNEQYKKR